VSALAPGLNLTLPQDDQDLLRPWLKRRDDARADRKNYEPQWRKNQAYAAGVQWLIENPNTGEIRSATHDPQTKRLLDTVDVLSQYSQTAIGKLAQGDLRPELLCSYDHDELADEYTEQLNDALAFAWEEECKGDRKLIAVLRCLVELGTCAIRCRYDRTEGNLIADAVPHLDGKPILDKATAYAAMSDPQTRARISLRPVREGKIVWEKLAPWNLLPPPGIEDPDEFPWHLIVRPVALTDLLALYGDKAAAVRADRIEDLGGYTVNNLSGPRLNQPGLNQTTSPVVAGKLYEHALVYTGYLLPDNDFPAGQMIVFSHDGHLLDAQETLAYQRPPWGPRPGLTYFRWHVLEGRFWGRSFIEPGMSPQRRRNKRSSQYDEIIDRGLPRIWAEEGSFTPSSQGGGPLEVQWVKPGSTVPKTDGGIAPGAWMLQDIQECDADIEKTLGLRGPTLGNAPAGVSAYSAMALLTENDAVKLDPIAQEFKLGICDVVRDTVEAMQQWPANKQLLIAGDGDKLKAVSFQAEKAIPAAYIARPAKGGTLPRSQAAEVQKIADLWNAATVAGVVAQAPEAWIEWYKSSLDAGNALDLPRTDVVSQQLHKAALENIVMARTGNTLPVAPYDDPQVHVQAHRDEQMQLSSMAALGDTDAAAGLSAIEQHVQAHLMQAQENAGQNAPLAAGAPGAPAPGGQPFTPFPQYENTLQTPRLPRIGTNLGFR
jgi:hypothetical protein